MTDKKTCLGKFAASAGLLCLTAGITIFTGCGNNASTAGNTPAETSDDIKNPSEVTVSDEERKDMDFNADYSSIASAQIDGGLSCHDPSVYKDNGKYYIFGSHMTAASCTDLRKWDKIADGYRKTNKVYGGLFNEDADAFKYAGSKNSYIRTDDSQYHVWAPDVIYDKKTGKYLMYVSLSSTWNASEIALMQCDTIDGEYEYV
nr:hypothetical protein [Lachnospiraceae bacterium]